MKMSKVTIAAVVGTIIAFASTATPANANCTKSTWIKTSGDSLAYKIKGRDCGGVYSVKFSGPAGETGWLDMSDKVEGAHRAFYDDGNVATEAVMDNQGMFMETVFLHMDLNGAFSMTKGTYFLKRYK
jgi:hypothetical protein